MEWLRRWASVTYAEATQGSAGCLLQAGRGQPSHVPLVPPHKVRQLPSASKAKSKVSSGTWGEGHMS